jgi:hypothetical protein
MEGRRSIENRYPPLDGVKQACDNLGNILKNLLGK